MNKRIMGGLPILLAALLLTSCGKTDNTEEISYRTYGINCMNSGDYEEAVKAFENALECAGEVGETEIDISLYKARAQFKLGDVAGALDTYSALTEYKEFPEAYFQRGNLNLLIGEYDAAMDDYNAAIAEDEKNYELYLGIYETLSSYGYDDEAQDFLKLAQNISGEKGRDHLFKGRIAHELGDDDTAIELLKTAVDQKQADANFYLADIYRKLGDSDTAQGYLSAYMESDSIDADALVKSGTHELTAGNYKQAILFLDAAMQDGNATDRKTMQRNLILAYEYSGDYANALTVLQGYVKEFPEDYQAEKELTFLETR